MLRGIAAGWARSAARFRDAFLAAVFAGTLAAVFAFALTMRLPPNP
jgi:hypothetical protein